ncbi:MAG: hypothetical protein RLZZ410_1602 [Pseudomonadota bacterium]|jgi:hypothetical protein
MKKVFFTFAVFLLSGCAGNLILVDKENKQFIGQFNSLSKTLEVNVNGKIFSGFYITNSSVGFSNYQMYGAGATATGSSQTIYGGNSGRAVLRSQDGDTIQCEFNYQGMKAIGSCVNAQGERYQLITG